MKVSREQFAANRIEMLGAASRLFREKGFDGVGLDAVMKAAGLTHGAFYSHFRSKDDLVAQACAYALAGSDESWRRATAPGAELARLYLADDHFLNRADGCALAALGSEVVRRSGATRRVVGKALRERVEALAPSLPGAPSARRERAIGTWAGLVGTLVLARAVADGVFSKEILDAGRRLFGQPHGRAGRHRSPRGRRRVARRVRGEKSRKPRCA